MSVELLRKAIPPALVNRLWQKARTGQYPLTRTCPACGRGMPEVPIALSSEELVHLDACTGCHFVWFDPREFEALPRLAPKPLEREVLSPQAKEALALAKLETLKHEQPLAGVEKEAPDHWWQFVAALCGIPVEYNDTPLKSRPIVTWALAIVIAVVSLGTFGNLQAAVNNWGLVPAEFARHYGLTFITSFFLHGGLFHLIGNLCFLIIFGDNTEDVLGKRRYLSLIAAAAVAGDILHILADPRADIPCVGASGGISGVLAYYCLRFPRASVGIVWWFRWFRVPVGVLFALWVLMQLFGALRASAGIGNVAVFAHLGGAAVGVLFWIWTRRSLSMDAAPPLTRPARTT